MPQSSANSVRQVPQSLLSPDFVMLFCLVMCSTCYLSIYYCFEQWMDHVNVPAGWRGLLLGSLFGMVMVTRPAASVYLLRCSKLLPMLISILISSVVLFSYQFLPVDSPAFVWLILAMRLIQGFCLAIFSSCSIALLVSCIPPGQSARGFALFSLTALIPYALIPTIGETLLPLVGDEPALYAWSTLLLLPCLIIIVLMRGILRQPEVKVRSEESFQRYYRKLVHSITHSGLGFTYLALLCSGLCTSTGIYFMKGLCSQTGGNPASYFFYYTCSIMVVRVLGNKMLDSLPCYRVVPIVGTLMALAMVTISYGPLWAYVPSAVLFGLSLSLFYPLQASVIYNRSTPETRSVNSNLMVCMFDFASLTSPLLGGAVLSAGLNYREVILLAAISALFSAFFFTCDGLRQRAKARREPHENETDGPGTQNRDAK